MFVTIFLKELCVFMSFNRVCDVIKSRINIQIDPLPSSNLKESLSYSATVFLSILFVSFFIRYMDIRAWPVIESIEYTVLLLIAAGLIYYYLRLIPLQKQKVIFSFVLLVGVAVHLGWSIFFPVEQTSDFAFFQQYAVNILEGAAWLNPQKQSGAPLFYALFYYLFGSTNPMIGTILNALLSGASMAIICLILYKKGAREAAIILAVLLSLWPEVWLYNNLIFLVSQFSILVSIAIYLVFESESSSFSLLGCLLIGVAVGASQYFRGD